MEADAFSIKMSLLFRDCITEAPDWKTQNSGDFLLESEAQVNSIEKGKLIVFGFKNQDIRRF